MKRYYYPASRAHHALCMAIDHGLKYVKRDGTFWSHEGIAAIDPAWDCKLVIAAESLHLLEPQVGDVISHFGMRAWRIDAMDNYSFDHPAMPNESLNRFTLKADNPTIIHRNGIAFMSPDSEDA